eukprot:SAG31_NODE_742_length_12424_cov_16.082353_4_plen_99_part_00
MLNFVDETAGGKALISSRVRGILEGGEIVSIGLPSEKEAVSMLMAAAGLGVDNVPPAEALDVARFCGLLPLALGMTGKLISEFAIDKDWGGGAADAQR